MVMEPPARVTGSHEVKLLSSLTTNGTTFTHLPLLPYNPSEHKRGIAIAWVFIVVNSSVLPIILVYSLWYGTSMSKNIIFSIVTALFGSINIAQSSRRIWRLVQKDGRLRPLGSRRGSVCSSHHQRQQTTADNSQDSKAADLSAARLLHDPNPHIHQHRRRKSHTRPSYILSPPSLMPTPPF